MKKHLVALALVVLAGLLLRVAALNDPITYDEAYTYQAFASQPLFNIVSDYSLPNNHIFHSVLVHFSALIFGNHRWALRLPAFIAGMLLVVATYSLGQRFYNADVGLAAAALTAFWPEQITHATEARGYSLLALVTLGLLLLGWQALRTPDWRLWAGIAVAAALGFWTIPIMLFPFGIVFVWLFAESFTVDILPAYRDRRDFLRYWLCSGLAAAAGTLVLYSPVLHASGTRYLLGNGFVAPVQGGEYWPLLADRLRETAEFWMQGLPLLGMWLIVLGFVLGLLFHRKLSTVRIPVQWAAAFWLTLVIVVRRPDAFSRFWSFLLAPLAVFAAAGIFAWREQARGRVWLRRLNVALLAGMLALLLGQSVRALPTIPLRWHKLSNDEAAAAWLAERLVPGDMVLVGYPHGPQVWYYLAELEVPRTYWQARTDFSRAYLLTVDQTFDKLLRANRLDAALLDLTHAEQVMRYGRIEIYVVPPAASGNFHPTDLQ